jgi:membrane protein YfhO
MPGFDGWTTSVRRKSGLLAPVALSVIILTPFASIILRPSRDILGNQSCDGPSQFYFFHDFAAQCWLRGEVPLWNPHVMLGVPFLGEGQASIFHPLSALFLFLPTGVAMNAMILLSFLIGGIAFYAYLRAIDLDRTASVFGAIVWSFSSVPIGRIYAGHANMVLALPTLPFMLCCWHRYLRDRRLGWLIGLAVGYASLHFAGYPQLTYLFSLFFLIYVVLHAVAHRSSGGTAVGVRDVMRLGVFVALGIALGAAQLLPSLDFARHSFRSRASYEFCTFFSLPPESFITLLCPEFFGRAPTTGDGQFWGRAFFWESWLYVGILPLLVAVTGFLTAPGRLRWALGIPAALFLVLGLGRNTPLYQMLYDYVPLYDVFRSPAKHAIVTVFCLAVLAAHGFQFWLSMLRPVETSTRSSVEARILRRTIAVGFAALVVCLVMLVLASNGEAAESHWGRLVGWVVERAEIRAPTMDAAMIASTARFASQQLMRSIVLLLLSLTALLMLRRRSNLAFTASASPSWAVVTLGVLLLADFFTFIPHFTDRYNEARTEVSDAFRNALPKTPYPVRVVDQAAYANAAMKYGFSSIGGYMGNTVGRYNRFLNATQGFDAAHSQASATIRAIPDLYLLLVAIDALHLPASTAGFPSRPTQPGWALLDTRGHCPRALIAAAPHAVAGEDDSFNYILSPDADLQGRPVVEASNNLPPPAPLDDTENVAVKSFATNRIELIAETTRPRVIVLNEMYDKDWNAMVNGVPTPIHAANYLFRSVVVPPGKSSVVFEYRPPSFLLGSAISGLALLIVVAALAAPRLARKQVSR